MNWLVGLDDQSSHALLLIQIPLEACEDLADFVGLAKIGDRVRQ